VEFLVVWLVAAAAVGFYAMSKNRTAFGWFVVAVVISPLIAWVILLVLQPVKKETGPYAWDLRACPHCAEKILRQAKVCKHCGRDVPPLA
jgi:hypothetical protein